MNMRVRKFRAPSTRQALEIVRAEQGPDVIILANRKVAGGVEITTALEARDPAALGGDALAGGPAGAPEPVVARPGSRSGRPALWTDQNLALQMQSELKALRAIIEQQLPGIAWRDFRTEHPMQAALIRDLIRLGLPPRFARGIATRVDDALAFDVAWRRSLAVLAHMLPVVAKPVLAMGGRCAMLGPAGVGKSTSIIKAAARYALEHRPDDVAIITLDNVRIGAVEQLRAFGRILGVHVRAIPDPAGLAACIDGLQRCRLILIDTPGLPATDPRLGQLVTALRAPELGMQLYGVLSAPTDYRTLTHAVSAAAMRDATGWIVTKLDEAAVLGPALAVIAEQGLPLAYVSGGPRIPNDFEVAKPHRLITRAVTAAIPEAAAGEHENLELEQAFAC